MESKKTGLETIYTERYETCFELYLQCRGANLTWLEREMRARGFHDFHRRILYSRTEHGERKPGWIERFGWKEQLRSVDCGVRNEETRAFTDSLGILNSPANGGVNSPERNPQSAVRDPQSFEAWLKQVSPELTWDWKYQKYIYKFLQRVTDGTCKRLMIFMPPRHGKSELVTVRYAGWRLWNDPKMKIIVSSYNQKLADRFSRSIRKLLSEEEDKRAAVGVAPSCITTPSRPKLVPPLLRQGVENSSQLPSLSEEGCPPLWADGVVNAPADTQPNEATDSDGRIRQSCDHPQCTGKAQPLRSANGQSPVEGTSHESQIAGRNSQIPRMFPRTRTINTASQWETAFGGGVKAVGVGAGVTGFGGQLIVIDDPVKSRAEAESPTYRERLWDWYRNDLYTRLEPNAAVILIQTRWHQDDLAGRLLQEMQTGGDHWDVIDLPALSEPRAVATGLLSEPGAVATGLPSEPRAVATGLLPFLKGTQIIAQGKAEGRNPGNGANIDPDPEGVEPAGDRAAPLKGADVSLAVPPENPHSALRTPHSNDPLGRPVGAALCPDRFDEAKLADIQRQLGGYNFAALYQQHPTPAEGGIFKRAWFTKFVDQPPKGLRWKRGYDLAVSTKTTASYTASFRVARDERTGNLYIADGFRERIEYPDQKRYVIERMLAERDTDHGIEKALHGQALLQDLRLETRLFGKGLTGVKVTGDKVTRALTWAPLAEEGKVILVRAPWNRTFLDEVANFPAAPHDDQIDAVSLAVSMLPKKGGRAWSF
ncbi:MAG: phage terminase large subunit [Pyrinomonadaceae bacterium]